MTVDDLKTYLGTTSEIATKLQDRPLALEIIAHLIIRGEPMEDTPVDVAFEQGLLFSLAKYEADPNTNPADTLEAAAAREYLVGSDTVMKRWVTRHLQSRAVRIVGKPLDEIDWATIDWPTWIRIIGIVLSILMLFL